MSLTVAEALQQWNKCDISDAALQLLINETRRAIELHKAFGDKGLVVDGLSERLRAFQSMKELRSRSGIDRI